MKHWIPELNSAVVCINTFENMEGLTFGKVYQVILTNIGRLGIKTDTDRIVPIINWNKYFKESLPNPFEGLQTLEPMDALPDVLQNNTTQNPETVLPSIDGEPGSRNNGGKTDYYLLESAPFPIEDFDDFAEWRNLNGFQFNIGKVVWTFNQGRHAGTDYLRDLNKIIHYANREKQRISRQLGD